MSTFHYRTCSGRWSAKGERGCSATLVPDRVGNVLQAVMIDRGEGKDESSPNADRALQCEQRIMGA